MRLPVLNCLRGFLGFPSSLHTLFSYSLGGGLQVQIGRLCALSGLQTSSGYVISRAQSWIWVGKCECTAVRAANIWKMVSAGHPCGKIQRTGCRQSMSNISIELLLNKNITALRHATILFLFHCTKRGEPNQPKKKLKEAKLDNTGEGR